MRNSSLVELLGADNNRALSILLKLRNIMISYIGRRAFQLRRMVYVSIPGVIGKADVGISNDNEGEKPSYRKTKVS